MSTRILALLDDEMVADKAAKEIDELEYDDLEWQFITTDESDARIVPGIPARSGTDMARPVGFIQETQPPAEYSLGNLDLSDEEKAFFAQGLSRNAIVILVDTPDDALETVEQILADHNAGRFTEA